MDGHALSRARYSVLAIALLTLGSAILYWGLWLPAYRLNERFEYADLLFTTFPAIAGVVAAQLRLARAVPLASAVPYDAMALLVVGLFLALFGLYALALRAIVRIPRRAALATVLGATVAFQVVLLP